MPLVSSIGIATQCRYKGLDVLAIKASAKSERMPRGELQLVEVVAASFLRKEALEFKEGVARLSAAVEVYPVSQVGDTQVVVSRKVTN